MRGKEGAHPHDDGNYFIYKDKWRSHDWNLTDDPLALQEEWRESRKANYALREYAMMGAGRSLSAVRDKFVRQYEFWKNQVSSRTEPAEKPPTIKLRTLTKWCGEFQWVKRVERWDSLQARKAVVSYEEDRLQARRARLEAAKGTFDTVARALMMLRQAKFEPRIGPDGTSYPPAIIGEVSLPALVTALEKAMTMLRVEYGEDIDRLDVTSAGQPITIREVIVERRSS